MGSQPSLPSEEQTAKLRGIWHAACQEAAGIVREAEVLLLCTGAGFSADSGLAVYADVAKVGAYALRELSYRDICQPHWLSLEPELFWGFWGQCFNDYRSTAPHDGYRIIEQWVDMQSFRTSDVARRIRSRMSAALSASTPSSAELQPFLVHDQPGAFFAFTSNVDAHHYDWFHACEIRECHGNVELYQCAGSESDEPCSGAVWRAPLSLSFNVDLTTMLAPESRDQSTRPGAASSEREAVFEAGPRVGSVGGEQRTTTLRYMPAPLDEASDVATAFEGNHPRCWRCQGPARPAILMFGDSCWIDSESQSSRWDQWRTAVEEEALARSRAGSDLGPLRVAILEIGAGGNVTTVRNRAEGFLSRLLPRGADARLIRINPDLPLGDSEKYAADGESENKLTSIMAGGLESLRLIDSVLCVGT